MSAWHPGAAALLVLLPLAGCSSPPDRAPAAYAPDIVIEVSHSFPEPPMAVELGATTHLESGGFLQEFLVSGAQIGKSPAVEMGSSAFLASPDGELTALTDLGQTRVVLAFGSAVKIDITVPMETATAHPPPVFRTVFPVWLDGGDGDQPNGQVTVAVAFRGNGLPPADLRPFWEVAVPAVDGRVPTPDDQRRIVDLARRLLPQQTASELENELERLRQQVQPAAGGYTTAGVARIVGEICQTSLRALVSSP
jgi:hypothetical protein